MADYFDSEDLDTAVDQAIETLLWQATATEDDIIAGSSEFLGDDYGAEDLSPDAFRTIQRDVVAFIDHHEGAIRRAMSVKRDESAAYGTPTYNIGSVAHDYILTRNRHGVGFWDRGLGIAGELLTRGAHFDGEVDAYVGDDGLVHVIDL